jgi:hypothetical protein
MTMRILCVFGAVLLVSAPCKAEDGKDQTQSFDSPLPLAGGATLQASKDKTSLTIAFAGQGHVLFGNYWQAAVTGNADAGESAIVSSGSGFSPGLKGKFGLGYSSFQEEMSPEYDQQVDELAAKAGCLMLAKAAFGQIPKAARPDKIDFRTATNCTETLDKVEAAVRTWKGLPDEDAGSCCAASKSKLIKAVESVTAAARTIVAEPSGGQPSSTPMDRFEGACAAVEDVEWSAKACGTAFSESGLKKAFPNLHEATVTAPQKSFRFRLSGNWAPTLLGVDYRPVKDGTPDLSAKEKWVRLMNGASVDLSVHDRKLSAGVQFAYAEKIDEEAFAPVEVCRTVVQGEYSYKKCKSAALGEPVAFDTMSATATASIDPLTNAVGAFRPGLQVTYKWEHLEGKRRHTIALPVYLARVKSPFDLVVGLRPSYEIMQGFERKRNVTVAVFLGARP